MRRIAPSEKLGKDYFVSASLSGRPLSEAMRFAAQVDVNASLKVPFSRRFESSLFFPS